MSRLWEFLNRWGAALVMMLIIFGFSARPPSALPHFSWADAVIKKGGHMLGYGLLALAYWRGLGMRSSSRGAAWLMAAAYAITDEVHQMMVPGRNPSIRDVLIFDGLGALIGLLVYPYYSRKVKPALRRLRPADR